MRQACVRKREARRCERVSVREGVSQSEQERARASVHCVCIWPCMKQHMCVCIYTEPTLSPTDTVPRGLLTLCPAASSGPQGE